MDNAQRRKMAAEMLRVAPMTAYEALDRLPSIYQGIGKLNAELRRRKPGSAGHADTWNRVTKLENEGAELMSIVRLATILALPDEKS